MQGNPRQAALAYIAGIIDGEGTIRINRCAGERTMKVLNRRSPIYAPSIGFGMVQKDICDFFVEHTGIGSVRAERVHKENRQDIWRWATTGRQDVIKFIEMVLPYLIVKKPQAELLLKFCAMPFNPSWRNFGIPEDVLRQRHDFYLRMRKMNAVGAAATTKSNDPEKGSDSLNS